MPCGSAPFTRLSIGSPRAILPMPLTGPPIPPLTAPQAAASGSEYSASESGDSGDDEEDLEDEGTAAAAPRGALVHCEVPVTGAFDRLPNHFCRSLDRLPD